MFEEYPKMLYKIPGAHAGNDGVTFDYILVGKEEDAPARADGWMDFADAISGKPPVEEPMPTRAEREAKATELGIKFDGRTSDKKLDDLISAALKA